MKTIFCITGLAIQGLAMSVQAQTGKPNIVVIMTDQQRADLCGREGFPLEVTPFVDRLAQENVWFNKAYTVMPASSPARCSMFTGRFPSATHVRTNHNIPDISYQQDLVGVLKENGYKTALVGKNHAYLKPADLDFWSLRQGAYRGRTWSNRVHIPDKGCEVPEKRPIRRKDFLSAV